MKRGCGYCGAPLGISEVDFCSRGCETQAYAEAKARLAGPELLRVLSSLHCELRKGDLVGQGREAWVLRIGGFLESLEARAEN